MRDYGEITMRQSEADEDRREARGDAIDKECTKHAREILSSGVTLSEHNERYELLANQASLICSLLSLVSKQNTPTGTYVRDIMLAQIEQDIRPEVEREYDDGGF